MNILAIDTSSNWLSIVCGDSNGIKATFSQSVGNQHSERLAGAIEIALEQAGWKLSDIGLAGVVTGPGSFTGLRVGISFIKGLAMALGIRTVGLNTLDALAHAASGMGSKTVSPMIDARKGQVYAALYNVEQGSPVLASGYAAVSPSEWLTSLPRNTLVIGSGVEAYRELITTDDKSLKILEENIVTVSPETLYERCTATINASDTIDHEDLDAFYIRQADAVCQPKKH